jgi:hypothetical protein
MNRVATIPTTGSAEQVHVGYERKLVRLAAKSAADGKHIVLRCHAGPETEALIAALKIANKAALK